MIELFYAPYSRASRIYSLLVAMDVLDQVTVTPVAVQRLDGSGGADPANPHPEGKVPTLRIDGAVVYETGAVMLALAEHFASPLAPPPGDARRGALLTWMFYYGNVIEPVIALERAGVGDTPLLRYTFRSRAEVDAALIRALADGRDWLLGAEYTLADLLIASVFSWNPDYVPDDAKVKAWAARALAQPWVAAAVEHDKALMAQ